MNNTNYNQNVLDHFKNPRNMGEMKNADAVGELGNPHCGDVMKIYLKIKDQKIEDIKFQTMGCAAAIATSSMLTVLAKGKSLKDAKRITNRDVATALGELPPIKIHCSNLAADALQIAIKNYEEKKDKKIKFREFLLSTNKKIVMGKDSSTNDELVSQAQPNDTLLHTAAPGSPFCNVGENPTKEEIKEAAALTASKSQIWRDSKKDVVMHIFKKKDMQKDKSMKSGTWAVKNFDEVKIKKAEVEKCHQK
jgi:nitrogen fixation NifU-like protein